MNKLFFLIACFFSAHSFAQITDTTVIVTKVTVNKDFRLELIGRKEAEINEALNKMAARSAMGYRLQVLSTNDRELAMKTRTQLLQKFPEQKVYMLYQEPYVKLKFGNFRTKPEAEKYRSQVSKMLGGTSIYLVPERIEVKPEKEVKEDETTNH